MIKAVFINLTMAFSFTIASVIGFTPTALAKNDHSNGSKNQSASAQHSQGKGHKEAAEAQHSSNKSTGSSHQTQASANNQAGSTATFSEKQAVTSESAGNSNAHNKVTICHATGSRTNPFVRISPNANGVINGHVGHQDGRDIIPPFDYNDHGTTKHFPGQNWDAAGQAIFNNGCKIAGGQGGGVTPPVTPPSGGNQGGGQVLGAVTGGQGVASSPAVLPNTGLKDAASLWGMFELLLFAAAAIYWREVLAPRQTR